MVGAAPNDCPHDPQHDEPDRSSKQGLKCVVSSSEKDNDKDEESEYDPRHETGAGHRIDRLGMSLRVASYVDDMADEDHAPYEDEQHRRHRRNECECSHDRVFRGEDEGRSDEDDGAEQSQPGTPWRDSLPNARGAMPLWARP